MPETTTAQAISAAGTVIAATAGLTTAVVSVGSTIVGPFSSNSLAVKGSKVVDDAEKVIYKKHEENEGEGYIIPPLERTKFINGTTTPLVKRGVELDKATRTVFGSFRHYPSACKFYRDANYTHNDAEELSGRFQQEHRSLRDREERERQERRDEGSGHSGPQQEGPSHQVASSYHARYPPANVGQGATSQNNYPLVNNVRINTTASSQHSYSTARTSPPSASQRYTSGDVSESPVTFEGPSFANIQGPTYGSAQGHIHSSHRTPSANATEQYSASCATNKKHTL